MRILLLILLTLLLGTVTAQTYMIGYRSSIFIDAARGNRSVNTALYYPANSSGDGVPIANGTAQFPVIVFGHGFVMPYSAYRWLADSLVQYGYILAFPTTEGSLSPNHSDFGKDIAFLCQRITALTDSTASFLFGRVMNKSAAGGHSMGGGASFLAMLNNTSINALFNFAAAETNPSAKSAAFSVQKPALIFAGTSDCIVHDSNQLRMYNNIPYTCKTYIDINNGLHCHFGNNDFTCVLGQISSGCNNSTINSSVVFNKIQSLLLPFLDYYLKGICTRGTDFENTYNNITGVNKQRTCTVDPFGCSPTGIIDLAFDKEIKIMPDPISLQEQVKIQSKNSWIKSLWVADAGGRVLYKETGLLTHTVILKNVFTQKGLFIITVMSNDKKAAVRKLIVN